METATLDAAYETQPTLIRAGQGRRLVNLLIDYLAIFSMFFVLGIVMGLAGQNELLEKMTDGLMGQLLFILFSLAYYTVMEGLFGRTLGKMLTRTRVVTDEGTHPSFGTILKRSLWRFIPFDALSFLGNAYGWHDSRSDTMVVRG
ncbi:putative RDD family membrane protein YckC [Hymenobacter luteus]|uniref:RDD family membrane protein YckC n=2 Tax=Hymenobacter TaxID=89966 RepID=A0ABR6JU99_9BACT|nr:MULTISPECIES: RDD family protein [Hymenobacter]MBB4600397.1 putative RDD family membrane protein YckC [Hymenobacter latericoloratus]MBB6057293.1 putative RDD family membrane protein YckC [Hymenobacter luteus]